MRLAPDGRLQLLGLLMRLRQLRLQRLLAIFQRLLGLRLGVEPSLDARLSLIHKLDDRLIQELIEQKHQHDKIHNGQDDL